MQIHVERLFRKLASDVGLDSRTVYYCVRRYKNEGIQFFTVTLPKLSKAVLRSLELGYFDRPSCFAWKGSSLRYFRSLLRDIFDQRSGRVLDHVCPVALYAIRQICEYFYKLVLEFSPDQEQKAEQDYLTVEDEVRRFSADPAWISTMRKYIAWLFPDLDRWKPHDVLEAYRPRFTKGSFAGSGELFESYYRFKRLPDYLVGTTRHEYEGVSGFFKPYPSSRTGISLKDDTSRVAEVLFVPKDSRGPRVISKEPLHQLRMQMAFFDWFSNYLEDSTNGRINFANQSINRRLAHEASISRKQATIDLKEASDRVQSKFICALFEHCSSVRYFVRKRSTHYKLPSGYTGRMYKLSGMGSGLTFSLLAFTVYVSVVAAICERVPKALHSFVRRNVYVYGDDLVVPSHFYDMAKQGLERSGLLINVSKSYSKSFFRESCGGDYYYGNDVTPARIRLSNSSISFNNGVIVPANLPNVILQLERHCRELVKKQLFKTAEFLYQVIESVTGKLPLVAGDSPVIGRWSETPPVYETDLQGNYETLRVLVPSPVKGSSKGLCPYKALSHSLKPTEVSWTRNVFPDDGSLAAQVSVPRQVKLYRRKVSAFRLMA